MTLICCRLNEYQCLFFFFVFPPPRFALSLYLCVGLLVPVRVGTFALFCSVFLAYTPVPLFAVCLLPLNQEVTPKAGDAGVPMVFVPLRSYFFIKL